MVDWFRTLPHAIDGIANAVKVYISAQLSPLVSEHPRSSNSNPLLLSCGIIAVSVYSFLLPAIACGMNEGI